MLFRSETLGIPKEKDILLITPQENKQDIIFESNSKFKDLSVTVPRISIFLLLVQIFTLGFLWILKLKSISEWLNDFNETLVKSKKFKILDMDNLLEGKTKLSLWIFFHFLFSIAIVIILCIWGTRIYYRHYEKREYAIAFYISY